MCSSDLDTVWATDVRPSLERTKSEYKSICFLKRNARNRGYKHKENELKYCLSNIRIKRENSF